MASSSSPPYVRVALLLVACVMVYGVALFAFKNEFETQSIQLTAKTTKAEASASQQPDFPSGYSTGIIEFLHDTPRGEFIYDDADNTFRAGQQDYWFGASYLATLVLAIAFIIVFLIGIPCCFFGATNCCGQNTYSDNKALQLVLKAFLVLTLVIIILVLITSFVANSEANNEFIPIIEVPNQLLDGLNDKLLTIQKEAASQGIKVPVEVIRTQRTLQTIQDNFANAIPDSVLNIVDALYDARGYAYIIVFSLAILLCIVGIVGVFLLRGKPLAAWLGVMFFCLFLLAICVAPLLFVNTVVADVCIDSNNIVMRPISDNTTAEITIFYLFCPDDFVPDLDFVDTLINNTETVLDELEEGKEEAEEETDTELVADYDKRIEQTQNLLIMEESLYFCNGTSQQYNDLIEDICQDSLKWNWVLMWLLFSALICMVFALCIGFGAVLILPPKASAYIDIPYDVVD